MLVLSRRCEEVIVIQPEEGNPIEVTILRVKDGTVRLGFQAERGVTILRKEIVREVDERRAS